MTKRPARPVASTATAVPVGRFRCALCGSVAIGEPDSHPRCSTCNIHLIEVTKPAKGD